MDDYEPSGFPIFVVVIILLISPTLAGCTSLNTSQAAGTDFTAWFLDLPDHRPTYQEISETLHVQVRNEGDAGTKEVCIAVDGVSTACQSASLVPGEATTLKFEVQPENGTHRVTVLNATAEIDVEPLPRIGEWINGSLVDLRVANAYVANETSQSWNWTVEARYHNGSTKFKIEWGIGLMETGWDWRDPRTQASYEGNFWRPIKGMPLSAQVSVVDEVNDNGYSSHPIEEGLFRWRWPDVAERFYG